MPFTRSWPNIPTLIHSEDVPWFNVKEYGAVGNGTADDTAAIQSAFDAAHASIVSGTFGANPVYFPNGRYKVTSTLNWKSHPIVGAGSWAVHIIWAGSAGGTCIDATAGGTRHPITGIQFRSGYPGIWLYKPDADFGDGIVDVFFQEASIACLKLGPIVNAYIGPRVRFALRGHGIWIDHDGTGSRSVSIKDFTFAEGTGGAGAVPGFLRITGGGASAGLFVAMRDGRLESASGTWAANSGLVMIDGTWSVVPTILHMENLACQMDTQSNNPAVYYKDAAVDNSCVPVMTAIDCVFGGFASWMGGTYSTGAFTAPPSLPTGRTVRFWSTGRLGAGSTQDGNSFQNIRVGNAGTPILQHLSGTATWDPASINDGQTTNTTVTVTGAVLGDTVAVGFTKAVPAGAVLTGAVTSADTVTVTLVNHTGSTLDLTSGTVRADVWQH